MAGEKLGVRIDIDPVTYPAEIEPILARLGKDGGAIFNADAFINNNLKLAVDLAARYSIPATQAGPSWDSKTRWNDLLGGLAVGRSKRTYELTSSIVPRGTLFHRVVELGFLLFHLISYRVHTAAASLVQRNSVPSTQRRCMTTAKRRASATIALFMPRRLAICIAQALRHDHRVERTSMLWAAS